MDQGNIKTGDEVLQMAIQMEELGKDFYESLCVAMDNPKLVQLCHKLAGEEANHRELFRELRASLAAQGKTVFLTDSQLCEARQKIKTSLLPDSSAIQRVIASNSLRDLLALAIQMEANAVYFYSQLAQSLPENNVVETIANEEQRHLNLLTQFKQFNT
jgi:rubrerythrin